MLDRYPSVLSAHQLHMVELFHALAGFTSQGREEYSRTPYRTSLVYPYHVRHRHPTFLDDPEFHIETSMAEASVVGISLRTAKSVA